MNTEGARAGDILTGLRITESDWEELLHDPVMAAYVLLGIELDVFQQCRLRYYWWVRKVMDSSGFSSGKTIVDWVFCMLRCMLIPDQEIGVYYPIFEQGKNTFWKYFAQFLRTSPIFAQQMGRTDEKGEDDGSGTVEGAGAYKAFFRNGNKLLMPAPSFMKEAITAASLRFNVLLVEEWKHIDATSDGVGKQLIGRVTRENWNQNHPIWGNHILFTSPAATRAHPGYKRYRQYAKEVRAGNPLNASLHYSYKDYSDLPCQLTGKTFARSYRDESTIAEMKGSMGKAEMLGEGYGIWAENGVGWFTESAISACVAQGRRRNVVPVISRAQWEIVNHAN